LDVVIVTAHWHIETEGDVAAWLAEYGEYFKSHFPARKVDVIIDLTDFQLSARAAPAFNEARAQALKEFNGLTYRVNITGTARVAMYTSNVLSGTTANEYSSIDAAIAALLQDRAKSTNR
jgi:hypothetical protein